MSSPTPPLIAEHALGIGRSIALCAVFYAVAVTVFVLLEVLKLFLGLPVDIFTSLLIQQLIAWPITLGIALLWTRTSLAEACHLRPFSARPVPALLLASFGATPLLIEAAAMIPVPEILRGAVEYMSRQAADSNKLLLFLPVVVVAPVAEELFFRGLVLRGYARRYGLTKAVWGSAVLFAVFHLNPWQAVLALPLGLAFAWLVLRTGSLLPAILGHAMVNFSRNFLLVPLGGALGYPAEQVETMEHLPLSMLGVGAAAVIAGSLLLWRQVSRLPHPSPTCWNPDSQPRAVQAPDSATPPT